MSGFVALFDRSGQSLAPESMTPMLQAIVHRGDRPGKLWSSPFLVLGQQFRPLAVADAVESLPAQVGGCVLVGDLRLDRREELLKVLSSEFSTDRADQVGDSCLVLAAYRRWGAQFAEQLHGDFSFVLWDSKLQRLFCVRDRIGVKPLYLYITDRLFACATEIKSLLACPIIPAEIDRHGLATFFHGDLLFQDAKSTQFQGIERLAPASVLELTMDRISTHRYWSLDGQRELQLKTDADYAAAFYEVFERAVSRRLQVQPAIGIGSTLSGGLDSSSIAVTARSLLEGSEKSLHSFSAVFGAVQTADESEFSDAVVAQGGLVAHQVHPDRESPFADLDRVLSYSDECFFGTNYFIPWGVYKKAQQCGVSVVLDGTDGDIAISHGIDRLVQLARQRQWSEFSTETQAITARFDDRAYATRQGIWQAHGLPELRGLLKGGKLLAWWQAVQAMRQGLRIPGRQLLKQSFSMSAAPLAVTSPAPWLNPDYVREVQLQERLRECAEQRQKLLLDGRNAHHLRDLQSGALPYACEQLYRLGGAFGVDVRTPFCDVDFLQYCLSLPPSQKLREGWSRRVLRHAMQDRLPEKICWRGGKADLSGVYDRGMRKFAMAALREMTANFNRSELQEFISDKFLSDSMARFSEGQHVPSRRLLWRAFVLEKWLGMQHKRESGKCRKNQPNSIG